MLGAVTRDDILQIILIVVATVALAFVLRWRRRSHAAFLQTYAAAELCEHLRPALELLQRRGHRVVRAGQKGPDMPLEVHVEGEFDPQAIADELKLQEPVRVSERGVLYCVEDFCEIKGLR